MKRRGNENIWIAYADMLTVLLMVYLLLALLFQVILATSRIVGKDVEIAKSPDNVATKEVPVPSALNEAKPWNQAQPQEARPNTPAKTPSEIAPVETAQQAETTQEVVEAKGDEGPGAGQEAMKLPLVMVDLHQLEPRDGDLRLDISLSRTYITDPQKMQVKAWAELNKSKISSGGKLRIYSVARSVGVSTGDVLSMQVNRAVATMSVLRQEKIPQSSILFDNLIVPDSRNDFLVLRIVKE